MALGAMLDLRIWELIASSLYTPKTKEQKIALKDQIKLSHLFPATLNILMQPACI